MKKLLFIFAAVISLVAYSVSIHADGAVKIYKNGNYTIFYANEVDSVVFVSYSNNGTDDQDGEFNADAIVGTWKFTHEEGFEDGNFYSKERTPDRIRYFHIDKDGTCIEYFIDNRDGDGKWEITVNSAYAFDVENKKLRFYSSWDDVITLTDTTLKLKSIYGEANEWWCIETYTKVDDSVLDDIK